MDQRKKREVKSPFDTALNYISYKQRTACEVEKYLSSRGVEYDEVQTTVDKLKEYNYINDEQYAQDFVSAYKRKLSARDIEQRLVFRGINSFIIEDALVDYPEHEQEETALSLAKSVVKKYKDIEPGELNKKIIRALAAKGFSYECTKRCISQIEEESDGS